MTCPYRVNNTCALAAEFVRLHAGIDLPIVTSDDACRTCRERHPEVTLESPGSVAAGLCRVQTLRTPHADALGQVLRPHLQSLKANCDPVTGCCISAGGPGDELEAIFATIGIEEKPGCDCKAKMRQMNAWGVSGCREHLKDILTWLYENYKRYGWGERIKAAMAMPVGLALKINPADPFRGLVLEAIRRAEAKARPTGDAKAADSVAVVIPCHNYGAYLAQCVESVLTQSHRPAEVVIVDDASDDHTAEVAGTFAARGVRYMRIEAGNVHEARRAGYAATAAAFLCFLDADDWIDPNYLAEAVRILAADWRCVLVHSDLHKFGDATGVQRFPERVTLEDIQRDNRIHAGSVVRRSSLRVSQALDRPSHVNTHADWTLWKRVLALGGYATKSPAVYHYRRHATSMMKASKELEWFDQAATAEDRITIVTPLAGRRDAWRELSAFFERQTWPHSQTALILADTSGDPEFNRIVRDWAAASDYADVRVMQFEAGAKGLADQERAGRPAVQWAVNEALCRIWSRIAEAADTPWSWTVEDDVIPPDDAAERLLRAFTPAVDAVCGPYRSRFSDNYIAIRAGKLATQRGEGIEPVDSAGFGCCMFRSAVLRGHAWGTIKRWYDPHFFEANRLRLLARWDCESRHLGA